MGAGNQPNATVPGADFPDFPGCVGMVDAPIMRLPNRSGFVPKPTPSLEDEIKAYRAFCAAMPDMMLRLTRDGTVLHCVPPHEWTAPLSAPDLIGKQPGDVLPEPAARQVHAALDQAFAGDGTAATDFETRGSHQSHVYEIRVVTTGPDHAIALIREVTASRRGERELVNRDRELERLIHASTRINAERTLSGVLQEIAHSARDVIGCHYAALGILNPEGTALDNFVVSGVSADVIEQIGDLPTGKGVLGTLVANPRPLRIDDLQNHPASAGFPAHHPPMTSFLGVPVLGPKGPIGNLYCTDKHGGGGFSEEDEAVAVMFAANAAVAVQNARLDEEAVRLLAKLQDLQRNRDHFYAMVNHELRNALTAVHGWSELLLRKSGHEPPRVVTETVESAQYALDLLNDLLDLSRLDMDKVEIRVEDTETALLAEEAASTIQPAADDREIRISISDRTDHPCRTDPRRVRQIIVNLLSNAVRHSPVGSTVTVAIDATDTEVIYRVIDTGEGIGPDELAIIFDAYARAETSTGGGTGLGLTLSRRLARLLGGDLIVESQPGAGATFTLTIQRFMS